MIRVGILGLGTVGAGTIKVLQHNQAAIAARTGSEVKVIAAACQNIDKPRDCDLNGITLTTNANEIVNNPDVDVVVELIGGTGVAKDLVLAAIANNKHVVTANKALIAKHGKEIFAAAESHGVAIGFEAAVAGGIPIVKVVREGLGGNDIEKIVGIVNGTCNYILTTMRDTGKDFATVLAEAKKLGYAEANHSLDVDGHDTADKLTILTALAYGAELNLQHCYTEGIADISPIDVAYAKELGYEIKLLGISSIDNHSIIMRVHPTLIPVQAMLAKVDGVMNAVQVEANAVGSTLYCGAGAGAMATASAVVADIIDVARAMQLEGVAVPYLAFQPNSRAKVNFADIDDVNSKYYLRLTVLDKPGTLAQITQILAEQKISIEAIMQKDHATDTVPVVILTHVAKEQAMQSAVAAINKINVVMDKAKLIRVEDI